MDYNFFMQKAYEQAKKAYELDEVPIGCVIVKDGEIIAEGCNLRNKTKNSLAHAEIIAINQACKKINDWRLEDCVLFVTVEPCQMCAGAIVQARIKEVVFGAYNKKFGSAGSVVNILQNEEFNHQVKITNEIMREECEKIMTDFFKVYRK